MKLSFGAVSAAVIISATSAFTRSNIKLPHLTKTSTKIFSTVEKPTASGVRIDKPTGTSFLPKETVERCEKGNPTEKAKLKKDPINAWVDIYEYARKIREGEMTWKEVEKADLDTVSVYFDTRAGKHASYTYLYCLLSHVICS